METLAKNERDFFVALLTGFLAVLLCKSNRNVRQLWQGARQQQTVSQSQPSDATDEFEQKRVGGVVFSFLRQIPKIAF